MSDHDSTVRHATEGSPPSYTWLWASLLVLVVAGAGVGAYFYVKDSSREPEPLPAVTVTVTAPPPTPTITPSPRETGTEFYDQIPSAVGAYVLVETAPNPAFAEAKAYDSYVLTYSNGERQITLQAGQWRTEAAATDAFNEMGGPEGWPGAEVDLTSTVCPEPAAGDTAALWRNVTAIFQVEAPAGGAADFYCRMPM
ncbi:MAG: hypothetical protein LBD51_03500 [Bifidobacteriaceae bacterium]|jgi:hypothetical protein|nr:hypothetical protein [Bifidobacteriaceae bacterium]